MKLGQKMILERYASLQIIQERIDNNKIAAADIGSATDAIKEYSAAVPQAIEVTKQLNQELSSDLEDGEVSGLNISKNDEDVVISNPEDEDIEEINLKMQDQHMVLAKQKLTLMAKKALEQGDYISLYRIERAIQEVEDARSENKNK